MGFNNGILCDRKQNSLSHLEYTYWKVSIHTESTSPIKFHVWIALNFYIIFISLIFFYPPHCFQNCSLSQCNSSFYFNLFHCYSLSAIIVHNRIQDQGWRQKSGSKSSYRIPIGLMLLKQVCNICSLFCAVLFVRSIV